MLKSNQRNNFSKINSGIIAEILENYFNDPSSIPESDKKILSNYLKTITGENLTSETIKNISNDESEFIRKYGYIYAKTDPLNINNEKLPENINSLNNKSSFIKLESIYLKNIGYEWEHLRSKKEKSWLENKIENNPEDLNPTKQELIDSTFELVKAEDFEKFIHRSFSGSRWYSLEGSEALIPLIKTLIRKSSQSNIEKILMGMPHRGRLNTLSHIFNKPYKLIFDEFKEENLKNIVENINSDEFLLDVKYHLGAKTSVKKSIEENLDLFMLPNPSHLEMITPVISGATLGIKDKQGISSEKCLPIIIHGDAAFAGQGIVAETFNLSGVEGYNTQGSIHIINNNQIGFTTDPKNAFSTKFSSDLARGFDIPILHVNADDIESCIKIAKLAIEYRNSFYKDILINLVGYRRFGHNEMDEPSFTQPLMYEKIKSHPTVRSIWVKEIIKRNMISENEISNFEKENNEKLKKANSNLKTLDYQSLAWPNNFPNNKKLSKSIKTKLSESELINTNKLLWKIPLGFTLHPKLKKLVEKRRDSNLDSKIEWGHAEILSLALLSKNNISVRLTGQDSSRGTFNQRHGVLIDVKNESKFNVFSNINKKNLPYIINSPLSEEATLGFEFGYSSMFLNSLVIWEAQFGDFANNAQSIIDELICSSQSKWGQNTGLTLLLPHGFEGMGPNHSSGHLERFLSLSSQNNITIANCTNTSQYFHLLRQQGLTPPNEKKPLVIMTPKSLLRHPLSSSSLEEILEGKFSPVLETRKENIDQINKIIICSGKISIEFLYKDSEKLLKNSVLIRLEQLYPFPEKIFKDIISKYKNVKKIIWLQEEPKNRGAWQYISDTISPIVKNLKFVGRNFSPSPASGSTLVHKLQQQQIFDEIIKE
ncbi:MAG: 2-oxoglutarate dehydrogenase E1 component [Chloroflexi bacterium]|nr:2-oxoglutarate dehydrogenase E1 component [Chloroflexota bacterium]|tara:strand:+ start:6768 stop:9410 length:2643 start_codon:yes stop_codon:yes gene_type:complete